MNIKSLLVATAFLLSTSLVLPVFANIAPIVDAGPDVFLLDGETIQITGTFFDPDELDPFQSFWLNLSGPTININGVNIIQSSSYESQTPTINVSQVGSIPIGGSTVILEFIVFDGTAVTSELMNIFLVNELSQVPVPAAVWLFGSGLIGLIGVARRKKA